MERNKNLLVHQCYSKTSRKAVRFNYAHKPEGHNMDKEQYENEEQCKNKKRTESMQNTCK